MGLERKTRMFDLLVGMGFKDIEIGYPSASEADFSFVRRVTVDYLVPEDVTVSVFTPAQPMTLQRFHPMSGRKDRGGAELPHHSSSGSAKPQTSCVAFSCIPAGWESARPSRPALRNTHRAAPEARCAYRHRLGTDGANHYNPWPDPAAWDVSDSALS